MFVETDEFDQVLDEFAAFFIIHQEILRDEHNRLQDDVVEHL
jgi:hypothetical protein